MSPRLPREIAILVVSAFLFAAPTLAADRDVALLDVLLENGSITQEQYDALSEKDAVTAEDLGVGAKESSLPPVAASASDDPDADDRDADDRDAADRELDDRISKRVADAVATRINEDFPVKASYGKKGFRLETRDGNWQTNLQWRFQFRLTNPDTGDPRQVADFKDKDKTSFQVRRARMKIGGHGYRPWLKYYFEVDLQPSRDADDSSSSASARLIDWRIDIAKYKKIALRVGQWKIDYNRERVDSSGRQEFVERSIVNRIFTIDRQMGVSLRGRLFEGTHADMRYYAGVFTGEGRGVTNDDNNMMYAGRLQWNFLGRDLGLRQTDVERTELPTAAFGFAAATNTGRCTRWSSSGCGSLDGFASPAAATRAQYKIVQAVEDFAFKWQGLSIQQEFHWKRVTDRDLAPGDPSRENEFYGLYAQTGYFFSELCECFPEPLELAVRYAFVHEPNETDRTKRNKRQEVTTAANWFFAGHNNKLTFDYSYLMLDDRLLNQDVSDHRFRLQWDVSF